MRFMKEAFLDKFVKWQRKRSRGMSRRQKFVISILTPPVFLLFILSPGFLFAEKFDEMFVLLEILPAPLNIYFGLQVSIIGLALYLWTVFLFFAVGKGTQTPVVPTQKLVTKGPYAYCRNPMVLGVILFISGLGILFNSLSFIAIGFVIPFSYLVFIKFVEEKELELRFDEEYRKYKKRIPFLIPKF